MTDSEKELLNQLQTIVNQGDDYKNPSDIDMFIDIMGGFNPNANTILRLKNMMEYCEIGRAHV